MRSIVIPLLIGLRSSLRSRAARTHLALGKDAPIMRKVQPPKLGQVIEILEAGGLHRTIATCGKQPEDASRD